MTEPHTGNESHTEQLLAEQSRHWQQGTPIPVEDLLAQRPDVRTDPDLVLDLICHELLLRERIGEQPELEEYLQRFPQLTDALRDQFEAHRALGDGVYFTADPGRTGWVEQPAESVTFISTPAGEDSTETPDRPHAKPTGGRRTPAAAARWAGLLAPAQEPGELGRLGRYPVLQVLGAGGMGAVFQGRDPSLGRDIALKVILQAHQGQVEAHQRFLEEAQIAGQLQHPGIVPVYELGQAPDQRPYFTMKLVKGRTLAALLRERDAQLEAGAGESSPATPRPADVRLLGIFKQVCQALAYAHARGVIHRDLKPSNIMVGAFGEVQVMDWGLAKQLQMADGRVQMEKRPDTVLGDASANLPSAIGHRKSSQTQTGSVLGTPAYMAPEQARGEVTSLDVRCDVFGLGAILCQILTGQPPYTGPDLNALLWKAAQADLAEAWAQLDHCHADAELVVLTRRCLAARREDRPDHAGLIAEALEQYEALVQQRLRTAELEREKAQVQAVEERKRREVEQARAAAEHARADEEQRRRIAEQARTVAEHRRWRATLAAATAALLLLVGAASAALWYQQDRADQAAAEARQLAERDAEKARQRADQQHRQQLREQAIAESVTQATQLRASLHNQLTQLGGVFGLVNNPAAWQQQLASVQAAVKRARDLEVDAPEPIPAGLRQQLQTLETLLRQDEADRTWALRLEKVREDTSALVDGQFNNALAEREYPKLFREAGLILVAGQEKELAARIRQSPVKEQWAAALDGWAWVAALKQEKDLTTRLWRIAQLVDPDPWKDQVRQAHARGDRQALTELARQALADETTLAQMSPQMLNLLGRALGMNKEGERWLRRAQALHPADFWLNFNLANALSRSRPLRRETFFRAALAVRPRSVPAWNNLGTVLSDQKDYQGAAEALHKALQLAPDHEPAWSNLGVVRRAQKDLKGAAVCLKKALQLDPQDALAWNNLGLVLRDQKDFKGAKEHYQKALEIDPKYTSPWNNLGIILMDQKDFKGAAELFQKVLQLRPKYAPAWNNLGNVLYRQNDLKGAAEHYNKAKQLDPRNVEAWNNLGNVRRAQKDLPGAVACYRKAVQLDPDYVPAWHNLGLTLRDRKDFQEAAQCFDKVLQLDRNQAPAWYYYGHFLYEQKNLKGAETHFRKAVQINPQYATAWANLGVVRYAQKDVKEAAECFRKARELDPKDAQAWAGLGAILNSQGDLKGAATYFQKALQLDPNDVQTCYNLGIILGNLQDVKGAAEQFQKTVQLDPNHARAWHHWGTLLVHQHDLKGAAERFQKAVQLTPNYAEAWHDLGNVLADQHDLTGAARHLRKALEFKPNSARLHFDLATVLQDQQDRQGAIRHYRQTIKLDPDDAEAHCNLGQVLRDQGQFREALEEMQRGHALGSQRPRWRYPSAKWVAQCQQLLQQEQRATDVVQGKVAPSDASEQLPLAQFCRRYQRYRSAVRLYAGAFAAAPKLADTPNPPHRYHAASSAALAAAGQGREAGPLTAAAKAQLRAQALVWLRADLTQRAKLLAPASGAPAAVTQPTKSPQEGKPPGAGNQAAAVLQALERLTQCQTDADLASLREDKGLAQLPAAEQKDWRQLWADVRALEKTARGHFLVSQHPGVLTSQHKEQVHEIQLQAGKTYVIDLATEQFRARLKLQDTEGRLLREDNGAGGKRNARLVFTATQDGLHRVVATSLQAQGTGHYKLILREFALRK